MYFPSFRQPFYFQTFQFVRVDLQAWNFHYFRYSNLFEQPYNDIQLWKEKKQAWHSLWWLTERDTEAPWKTEKKHVKQKGVLWKMVSSDVKCASFAIHGRRHPKTLVWQNHTVSFLLKHIKADGCAHFSCFAGFRFDMNHQ